VAAFRAKLCGSLSWGALRGSIHICSGGRVQNQLTSLLWHAGEGSLHLKPAGCNAWGGFGVFHACVSVAGVLFCSCYKQLRCAAAAAPVLSGDMCCSHMSAMSLTKQHVARGTVSFKVGACMHCCHARCPVSCKGGIIADCERPKHVLACSHSTPELEPLCHRVRLNKVSHQRLLHASSCLALHVFPEDRCFNCSGCEAIRKLSMLQGMAT
jgi:hypothetical protein